MNKYIIISFMLIGFMSSCNNNEEHNGHKKIYTCPMHPQIIRNEPGQCPICGMKLVKKQGEGQSITDSTISLLLKPTNEYVFSQIKTISPEQKEFPLEIDATGIINYDTRGINTVSARVSGWIEKLYVKYQFQPITKGQKLMDIYSKELLTEQENLLFLLKNDTKNTALIGAAEKRLLLQGFNKEQIEHLKQSKKAIYSLSIYSPYSGHLHDLNGISVVSSSMDNNMNEKLTTELIIKEGMYVRAGQNIFNIYNTEKVWAILDIYNESIELLETGQPLKISVKGNPQYEIEGEINFIEPVFNENRKTTSVRVYLDNSKQNLKIGQLLKAKVNAGTKKGFFIPSTAVVYLGNGEVVFIKENNILRSTVITTGIETEKFIEVVSGVSGKDKIAENAQMLIDSESFIKLNYDE